MISYLLHYYLQVLEDFSGLRSITHKTKDLYVFNCFPFMDYPPCWDDNCRFQVMFVFRKHIKFKLFKIEYLIMKKKNLKSNIRINFELIKLFSNFIQQIS